MAEVEKREETADLKSLLKKISAGAQYREMKSAWEAGRPICVASAGVPIEILYAMEVQPIYPESHAAIAAGIGKAQAYRLSLDAIVHRTVVEGTGTDVRWYLSQSGEGNAARWGHQPLVGQSLLALKGLNQVVFFPKKKRLPKNPFNPLEPLY